VDQTAAQGTGATGNTTDPAAAFSTTEGWIDLWISDDGKYLYQCYGLTGTVGVFEIDGTDLTLIQEVSGNLPQNNVQGIVSVGQPSGGQSAATVACAPPSNPRVSRPASQRVRVDWAPVAGAQRYIVQARIKGRSTFRTTTALNQNFAIFFVPPNREIEYRIRTFCSNGRLSEYSPIYELSTGRNLFPANASSRNGDIDVDVDLTIEGAIPANLQVTPNPFNEQITVEYEAKSETAKLSIYHISGAKVYEQALPVDTRSHYVPMVDLDSGVYILAVQEKGQAPIQRQIIKQSLRR